MFKIADGREYLYQWDLDRQVIVDDKSIVEVHFCNRTDECSLVTEVIDGKANIPNILLQNSFDIRVFGYDGKATLHDKTFKVKPRTRPSEYVYTETEVRSYDELVKRIDSINECDTYFFDLANYEWPASGRDPAWVPDDLAEFAERTTAGEYVGLWVTIRYAEGAPAVWVPATWIIEEHSEGNMRVQFTRAMTSQDLLNSISIQPYIIWRNIGEGWRINTKGAPFLNQVQYKEYVDNAITKAFADVVTAEGGSY